MMKFFSVKVFRKFVFTFLNPKCDIKLVYVSLDEKRYILHVNYLTIIFLHDLLNVYRSNKFCEIHNK